MLASERAAEGGFVYAAELPRSVRGRIVQFLAQSVSGDAASATFDRRDGQIVLLPANERLEPMVFDPSEVEIYGKVVTVMRRL